MNNKIPDFVNDLTNYLSVIKNFSNHYIENLLITVQQFLNFINVHKYHNEDNSIENMTLNDIRALNNSDIYSFIYFLAENNYKTNTRILKVDHLRKFFDFLFRIKHEVFKQPFKQIKREKKTIIKLPNYLSYNESKKLLELYSNSSKINQIRNNAIIHLFLNCGLRISEMRNLNISDFDFTTNKFIILGKGNKERVGYLNDSTKNALLKYLEIRKNIEVKNKKDKDALFLSNYKTRIAVRTIQKFIKLSYDKVGIENENYCVHTLRHTCATILYKFCSDIKVIQELLGHVCIDTTQIYTHTNNEDVMKATFGHPLAKFKMKNAQEYSCA